MPLAAPPLAVPALAVAACAVGANRTAPAAVTPPVSRKDRRDSAVIGNLAVECGRRVAGSGADPVNLLTEPSNGASRAGSRQSRMGAIPVADFSAARAAC